MIDRSAGSGPDRLEDTGQAALYMVGMLSREKEELHMLRNQRKTRNSVRATARLWRQRSNRSGLCGMLWTANILYIPLCDISLITTFWSCQNRSTEPHYRRRIVLAMRETPRIDFQVRSRNHSTSS